MSLRGDVPSVLEAIEYESLPEEVRNLCGLFCPSMDDRQDLIEMGENRQRDDDERDYSRVVHKVKNILKGAKELKDKLGPAIPDDTEQMLLDLIDQLQDFPGDLSAASLLPLPQ